MSHGSDTEVRLATSLLQIAELIWPCKDSAKKYQDGHDNIPWPAILLGADSWTRHRLRLESPADEVKESSNCSSTLYYM